MAIKIIVIILVFLLQGCASSDLSRNAAGKADHAYSDVNQSLTNIGNGSLADSYQNTSQTTKGVLIGGVTGGILGGITNGVGAVAGVATGAILGGALGAYIDAHSSLVDQLKNREVKVYVLGDQVLIVLFSNRTFYSNTSNIRITAYSTLDLVSRLIGNYSNMTVKVSAYTDASGAPVIDRARSQQQAEAIAKYLWKRGVNTRLLYAAGYGGSHLVTKTSGDENSENFRVEITLEKLPV